MTWLRVARKFNFWCDGMAQILYLEKEDRSPYAYDQEFDVLKTAREP